MFYTLKYPVFWKVKQSFVKKCEGFMSGIWRTEIFVKNMLIPDVDSRVLIYDTDS